MVLMVHLATGVLGSFILIPNKLYFKHVAIDAVADRAVPVLLVSTVFFKQNSKKQAVCQVILILVSEI